MTDISNREAYEIGTLQRQYLIWLLLAYVIAFFIPYGLFVVGFLAIYFVYKMADAQKSPVAWLWGLSQIIPYVGLVCLLIINQNATTILKSKGIKVGFFGAKDTDLQTLTEQSRHEGDIVKSRGCGSDQAACDLTPSIKVMPAITS